MLDDDDDPASTGGRIVINSAGAVAAVEVPPSTTTIAATSITIAAPIARAEAGFTLARSRCGSHIEFREHSVVPGLGPAGGRQIAAFPIRRDQVAPELVGVRSVEKGRLTHIDRLPVPFGSNVPAGDDRRHRLAQCRHPDALRLDPFERTVLCKKFTTLERERPRGVRLRQRLWHVELPSALWAG